MKDFQQKPVLLSLVLADYVHRDAATGKFSILGIFNTMCSAAFPGRLAQPTFAYVVLTEVIGEFNLQMRYRSLASDEVLLESPTIKIQSTDPLAVVEIGAQLPPLPMPAPGTYSFELYAAESLIGSRRIVVTAAPRPPRLAGTDTEKKNPPK